MLNSLVALYDSGVPVSTNSYESIQTVTVGSGGASSITFSSIPSTYSHLQIRMIARTARAVNFDNAIVRFNSDTGTNYSYHWLIGDGSSASASGLATQDALGGFFFTGSSVTANTFAPNVMDILDYANTNKYKTTRTLTGLDGNTLGGIGIYSGLWQSTSAINEITIKGATSATIQEYSSFALYGIKA